MFHDGPERVTASEVKDAETIERIRVASRLAARALTEAAKATGAFEVSTSRGDDGAGPVSVTAVELGQAPAKTPRR